MSRGIGLLQKKILELFNDCGAVSINEITRYVYDLDYDKPTDSQHKSVCRAVRKLEKRGLVKTKILTRKKDSRKDSDEHYHCQFVKLVYLLPALDFDYYYDIYFDF